MKYRGEGREETMWKDMAADLDLWWGRRVKEGRIYDGWCEAFAI